MHPCAVLLDEAFALIRLEAEALANDDDALLESLAEQRADLLAKAWKQRHGYDENLLRRRLLDMRALQEGLTSQAATLHESLRGILHTRRIQNGYFSGPRQRTMQNSKAYYFSKSS